MNLFPPFFMSLTGTPQTMTATLTGTFSLFRYHLASFRTDLDALFSFKNKSVHGYYFGVQPAFKYRGTKGLNPPHVLGIYKHMTFPLILFMDCVHQYTGRAPVKIPFKPYIKVSVYLSGRYLEICTHQTTPLKNRSKILLWNRSLNYGIKDSHPIHRRRSWEKSKPFHSPPARDYAAKEFPL
jgi:hypothetical protein